jgi:thiamine biosynthesis lipoprotein
LLSPQPFPGQPAAGIAGIAALNAAAGRGPQPLDARLVAVLARARDFCLWSEGAHGPLGRDLYALWGMRAAPPAPEPLGQAIGAAACDRLSLDPKDGTATLAAGSGADLRGFAEGSAVDRAVEVLRRQGAGNGFVQIGAVRRGFGPGPAGRGWPVLLPSFPDLDEPAGRVSLKDQSLAVVLGTESAARYLNQRTGLPVQGVMATIVVSDLAVDAQALAATLAITGPREGRLRLGSLRPQPSVLWLLGSGAGAPLLVDHRWSAVSRR